MARGSSSLPGRTATAGPRGAREAPDSLAPSFSRRPTSRSPYLDEPAPGDSDIARGRDRVELSPGRLDPPGPASRLRAAHPLRGHPEGRSPDHVGRADKPRRAQAEQTSPGEVSIGTTFVQRGRLLGRTVDTPTVVTTFEPYTRFGYRADRGPAPYEALYEFFAAEGGTRLEARITVRLRGAARFSSRSWGRSYG